MISKLKKLKKKAFTLVEVMIAVGVLSVSIAALIGILAAVSTKVAEVRSSSKAISLVNDLEVILKSKAFDEVYTWVRNPRQSYVVYFWDEYANDKDVDDPSLVCISSEDAGRRPSAPPNSEELKRTEGNIYRVLLSLNEDALKGCRTELSSPDSEYNGGPLPGSADMYGEAFLPITVEVLVDPVNDIVVGSGDDTTNKQRRVHTDLTIK
ncbi:MAG: type II secretion system protein, partial [Opitutales bacterium]|nr:type II secretion system protein [Opitutales bacterium]